jgi:ribose transport system ATP-binding protein
MATSAPEEVQTLAPVLSARGISKTFAATKALDGVEIELKAGEIHGLCGENGSGKSTLVKILAGVYQGDEGTIESANGANSQASKMTPAEARKLGIRVVHQDFPIFDSLTVAENLFLGRTFPTRGPAGPIDRKAVRRHAEWVLDRFKVPAHPGQQCQELNPAVKAMLAIARALQDCEDASDGIVILDEPTAALTRTEVETLLGAIRGYARDGQAILLVTHRLDEILGTCDRVTVLRDGRLVGVRERHQTDRRDLVEMIVGRALSSEESAQPPAQLGGRVDDALVLEMRGVNTARLHDVNLNVAAGEITGIAGLVGSGRTEILEAVFGQRPYDTGEVSVSGELLAGGGPAEAMARGVGMIPEDRGQDAAFALMSVRENLSVSVLSSFWGRGRMRGRAEYAEARELIRKYDISPADPDAVMSNLSGGNQQKVVLARWLRRKPTLLLLDEPTQGVDVGARAQIHGVIREAASEGAGVLLVSSDIEELVELSDRVVVLIDGRISTELRGERIDRDQLTYLVHAESSSPSASIQESQQ